jgi:hypothetical protein
MVLAYPVIENDFGRAAAVVFVEFANTLFLELFSSIKVSSVFKETLIWLNLKNTFREENQRKFNIKYYMS